MRSPGKYLRDCCSQSHSQCCTQTDWEARASPAGGRGLWGASYWGHREAAQKESQKATELGDNIQTSIKHKDVAQK